MSEIEKINISNLLNQVGIIKKKYDDLAEYTGENYNIFNVLGIYQDELSHSAVIGNLLNNKGNHGQKDTFLKLFLAELNGFEQNTEQFKVLHNFKTENSSSHIEKYIGKVDLSIGEGGRIDILIQEGLNNIIIENKVWAGDQDQQLVRYNNQDKKAPIIYLTLDGKEPSHNSKGDLTLGKDYICLSYKINIVRWLDNCVKEMANKPIIRESLNQYLVLVKELTHQSTNNKMKEEVLDFLTINSENINASKVIFENYQNAMKKLRLVQTYKLMEILNQFGIEVNEEEIKRSCDNGKESFEADIFIPLKEFTLEDDGNFELGLNVEFRNNYYFFCVLRKGDFRKSGVNTHDKFKKIKEFLHSKIDNLTQVNGWTMGKSNNFNLGINPNDYFFPNVDNTESFKEFAEIIVEFKKKLNE